MAKLNWMLHSYLQRKICSRFWAQHGPDCAMGLVEAANRRAEKLSIHWAQAVFPSSLAENSALEGSQKSDSSKSLVRLDFSNWPLTHIK